MIRSNGVQAGIDLFMNGIIKKIAHLNWFFTNKCNERIEQNR